MALTLLPLSMLSEAMKDDLPTPETAVAQSPDANEKEVAERRVWDKEEDLMIAALVAEHGVGQWSTIAAQVPNRNSKQCRERWHNFLDPVINKGDWTVEEDDLLVSAHATIGNKWALIAKHLPGRTDNQIKNRWNSALRRELRKLNRLAKTQDIAVANATTAATAAVAAAAGVNEDQGVEDNGDEMGPVDDLPGGCEEDGGTKGGSKKGGGKKGAKASGCKKRSSDQLTAVAIAAAAAAKSVQLDLSVTLPFGVTSDDQTNAKLLLERMRMHAHELNAATSMSSQSEGDAASSVEASNLSASFVEWMQTFSATLIRKSLMQAQADKHAPKQPRKRRRRGKAADKMVKKAKEEGEEGAEEEDFLQGLGPLGSTAAAIGGYHGGIDATAPPGEGALDVDELLSLVGSKEGVRSLMEGVHGLLQLSPRGADGPMSPLTSPLPIQEADFFTLQHVGQLLSPRDLASMNATMDGDMASWPASARALIDALPSARALLEGLPSSARSLANLHTLISASAMPHASALPSAKEQDADCVDASVAPPAKRPKIAHDSADAAKPMVLLPGAWDSSGVNEAGSELDVREPNGVGARRRPMGLADLCIVAAPAIVPIDDANDAVSYHSSSSSSGDERTAVPDGHSPPLSPSLSPV